MAKRRIFFTLVLINITTIALYLRYQTSILGGREEEGLKKDGRKVRKKDNTKYVHYIRTQITASRQFMKI